MSVMDTPTTEAAILSITRPHTKLWTYYILSCLVIPPLFPILILPAWFHYRTMRYRFDDEGISMSWGILFRREIIINYARIQDIHLQSNLVERWFGLARILVQTASGNSGAEMTIVGLREYEAVRDFLYSRMRGVKDQPTDSHAGRNSDSDRELATTLREVAHEMKAIRESLNREPPHE